ncbi:TonB family protein [Parvularcula dongshanensis]|uniref:TonB family protein n=1 Tax=Parvularcula dongshanensis TaxID=1173995 RepID=A0A840I2V6_9PROT|nr:TonB family protein [Parvularcula dongshanensis]MBB4658603.1 TonB family protein [Parvularcula dongshanensis]
MLRSADIVPLDPERSRRTAGDGHSEQVTELATAGAMLRAAREGAGLRLDRVADEINVKAERLMAIESMDPAGLPAPPYALGFVRAYAAHLDLPADPLVARFREEMGWVRSATAPVVKRARTAESNTPREVSLLAVLFVVGFLLWGAWQIVQSAAPDLPATSPEGFPIASRSGEQEVTYEVDTSLAPAAQATPTPAAEGRVVSAGPEEANVEPIVPPRTAKARDGLLPPLVPLVIARSAPSRDGAPVIAAPDDTVPSFPSRADRLNERQLAADSTDGASAPDPASAVNELQSATPAAVPDLAEPQVLASSGVRAVPAVTLSTTTPARLISTVEPVYPRRCESRAADEEVVTIVFGVSTRGRVVNPDVQNTTNDCFESAALAAVARFRFEPAEESGRSVATAGRTTRIVFRKP